MRLRAAVDDLALLAAAAAASPSGPMIADLHADERRADRADVGELVLGPEERGARAHLGLPEQQREVAAEAVEARRGSGASGMGAIA